MVFKLSEKKIKAVVKWVPVLTMVLLETANLLQIFEMYSTGTSEGQSVLGWLCVTGALCLWWLWYRVFTPDQKLALISVRIGICINVAVIITVLHFSNG